MSPVVRNDGLGIDKCGRAVDGTCSTERNSDEVCDESSALPFCGSVRASEDAMVDEGNINFKRRVRELRGCKSEIPDVSVADTRS
jgi:hypothetical protein